MKWLSYRPKVAGQITPSHAIGKWLEILTSDSKIKKIVEIGAWRGGGSTAIIAQGIRSRVSDGTQAYCLEANRERASEAAHRHKGQSNIRVIWGVIAEADDLDSENLNDAEKEWFREDSEWIANAPNVLQELPNEIDLLLLDGGEFSTYAEFQILSDRTRGWLILDDIRTRKCEKLFHELLSNQRDDFKLIWQSSERNGTAVFLRTTFI